MIISYEGLKTTAAIRSGSTVDRAQKYRPDFNAKPGR